MNAGARPSPASASPCERVASLGGDDPDEIGCRGRVGDEGDGLARPYRQRRQLTTGDSILVSLPGIGIGGQVGFPVPPSIEEWMA